MSTAVAFDAVTFRYADADAPALSDTSFTVPSGSFVLVCGRTGSGKSTLLRAMNGLVPHFTGGTFSGRVTVEGRDTLEHAPRRLSDVVAFVPQDPDASFVVDRVEDELAYAMENLGVEPHVMRRRVEDTLDLLDLEHLRDRSVRTLSGGERQRVAIAAALTPGARVLLLDEPTSQLDPQAAEDVLAALQRLVDDLGLTVVLAEHRLDRVAGFVDLAIACLGGGRVASGPPADMLELVDSGPAVTRLGRLLGWRPAPLTVKEARRLAAATGLVPVPPGRNGHPPRGASVIRADGLHVAYGLKPALVDAAIELRSGEVTALMGRNGSGKSTLLRCLAGAQRPDRGLVSFEGRAPRTGIEVGLCPQTPEDILFKDTVAGEVSVSLAARGRPDDPSVTLARLGIAHLAHEHPRDLSAGERLLVAIAAVSAGGPPVLLLDEPTRGLDVETKARLSSFLRAHAADGGAVLFASHDVELVAELADRVVMLAGGEIIADGSPREVLAESTVFSPQTARVFGSDWLTPDEVAAAVRV